MRYARLLLPGLALFPACAGSGGETPSRGPARDGPRPDAAARPERVVFRGYSWTVDDAGKRIPAAEVVVRSPDGKARAYAVRVGEAVGRVERDGDFRTGLTVVKIDKAQRTLGQYAVDERRSAPVVVDSYRLICRDNAGREQVLWLTATPPPSNK